MPHRILVISPVPSHPQNAGNRARVYSLMRALEDLGEEVHFAHIQETPGDISAMKQAWGKRFHSIPYERPTVSRNASFRRFDKRVIRKLKALAGNDPRYNRPIDAWYDTNVNPVLKNLATSLNPDVVIVEYAFFSKALECFDHNTLKIIDTHDIFADRYKHYQRQGQSPQWFSTTHQQERKGLNRADIVVAIQDHEASYFAKQLPSQQVVTVGHLVPLQRLERESNHNRLLFLASKNPINVHAINYFIAEVLPVIKNDCPNVKLVLAGEICNAVEDREDCLKLGTIDDLRTAYEHADIVINPIQFGTGLKVKNIEALAFGKPLVTTTVGASGLEDGIDTAYYVADQPKAFADAILTLLSDKAQYESLTQKAYEFATHWNMSCLGNLSQLLEKTDLISPSLSLEP